MIVEPKASGRTFLPDTEGAENLFFAAWLTEEGSAAKS
jgi:hypothetical protein